MSIEINGITPKTVQGPAEDAAVERPVDQTPGQQESGRSSTADTVVISDNAAQLEKVNKSVTTSPVVDTQRVEEVRQAIANGTHEVDPVRVAEKLMQFESILKPKG